MDDLEQKTEKQLRAIAKELKVKLHHRAGTRSIIQQIRKQQKHRVEAAAVIQADHEQRLAEPKLSNSEDDILQAIAPYTKIEGFIAEFPKDGTWIFTCRGAQDSGSMDIPLRIIKNKAMYVSKGRRVLRSLGRDPADQTYAGTIMVG